MAHGSGTEGGSGMRRVEVLVELGGSGTRPRTCFALGAAGSWAWKRERRSQGERKGERERQRQIYIKAKRFEKQEREDKRTKRGQWRGGRQRNPERHRGQESELRREGGGDDRTRKG